MKKIILNITILLFAFINVANSQVASISTVSGSYGNTQVDVNLTDFTGPNTIGAITMKIGFDANVAQFTGITYSSITSGIIANVVGNEIIIAMSTTSAVSVNGIGFKLNFVYTGGSCNLTFNQGCEIADGAGNVIQTTFLNGAIAQPSLTTTVVIGAMAGDYTMVNELPVTFSGFPITPADAQVGALSFNISYNDNALQFVGISGFPGAIANAANGVITISWSNVTPIDVNILNFKLKFNYLGGNSNVDFIGSNMISNANGVQIPAIMVNGGVTQPNTTAYIDIEDVTPSYVGEMIAVPMYFSGGFTSFGAFTFNIAYNQNVLTYIPNLYSGIVVDNSTNGILNFTGTFQPPGIPVPPGGGYIFLYFVYNGGSTTVNFAGLNEVASPFGAVIPVTYTGGNVFQPPTPVTVSLGNVNFVPGNPNILVPIDLSGTGSNVHAATMYVNFDITKLTFTGIDNNIYGAIANLDYNTNTIVISWANNVTSLIDGKFLDLKFIFNGGVGNSGIQVNFTTFNSNAGSLADNLGNTILVNWVNGLVNSLFKLSGTVKYHSDPDPRIPLVGFTVNLKSGLVTVATTTTDINGYYEFMTANGTYSIEVIAPVTANYYCDFNDAFAVLDASFATPLPFENALRLRACDVDLSGDIGFDDVLAVIDRSFDLLNTGPVNNFNAPDFLFENPNIIINFANLTQDILGICAGNPLGTNGSPN